MRRQGSVNDQDSRFYIDFVDDDDTNDDEQRQCNTDEDDEDGLDELISGTPQWPQSYRKSIDIYSHMASPGFTLFSPNVRDSYLSSSFMKNSESAASLAESFTSPLLKNEQQQQQQEKLPSETNLTLRTRTESKLTNVSSIKCPPEIYSDYHMKLPAHGCSFLQATLNGINVLAGVGVLSTPYALKEGGWLCLILLLGFALLCCYTGIILRRCLESGQDLVTYPDIGQAAFGRAGRLIISIILYTELYACCVEFLILEGDNLASLFPTANFNFWGNQVDPHKVFTIVAALVILPTVWLRDLSLLSYISAGGVIASSIVVFAVLWVGTVDKIGFTHTDGPLLNISKLPVAIGLFGFCFSGHAVFPNIYSSMKNQANFNRVLQVCFFICILMYGGIAMMGYTMFGKETSSQITLNLPNQFIASKVALWTTVVTPLTKYALTITPVALSLEELFPNQYTLKHHWVSVVIRTALVASTLAVAILIPFFGFVMAFIGSFLSLTGSLILPCACYLSIQRRKLSYIQVSVCVVTIFVGTVAAIAGTYSSVSGIINTFQHQN